MRLAAAITGWLLACVFMTPAQEVYVSHWGAHTSPFNSWETASTNINDALDIATAGSTVWVTNGVYCYGSTAIDGLHARARIIDAFTLRSVNGYRNTVIEGAYHTAATNTGANAVRALYMTNGVIDGFTLRRGSTDSTGSEPATSGGGVYASGGELFNIRIAGNRGYTAAGAWLQNCVVSNAAISANISTTGSQVKINSNVQLHQVTINSDGMMLPDIRILGTNDTALTNGVMMTSLAQGTDFGRIHTITGSSTHVFTVTNLGVRPLLVESVLPQGGHTGDWTVVDWPEAALDPGEAAPLEVQFDPQSPGARRTLFFVASNDPDDDPYAIWLSGEGIQAEMLVLTTNDWSTITNGSPFPLLAQATDFGDVRVTGDPKTSAYMITNTGSALMNVSQVAATNLQAADFSVTAPSSFPLQVDVSSASLTQVAFAPQELGYRTTWLRFDSDAVNSPYLFSITGRGVEPEMRVIGTDANWVMNGDNTPSAIDGTDFGLFTGIPITQSFSITNAGTYPLSLTGSPCVVIGGSDAIDFSVGTQPSGSIEPGGVVSFDITFFPTVATTRTATVSLYSDDVYFSNTLYQFSIQADVDPNTHYTDIFADISPASASAIKWADLNNDGFADLVVAGYNDTNRTTRIYQSQGSGDFTLLTNDIPGVDSAKIAVGDVDNDGWVDIALSGMQNSGPLTAIYRNQGDNTFTNIEAGLTAAYSGGLILGDFDNDGDLDLFVSGYTLSASVSTLYRNNGDLTFTATTDEFDACRNGDAVWIDYDNDGWLDLLIIGNNGSERISKLYRNNTGSFSLIGDGGITAVSHGEIAKADFDADGSSDLLVTGYSTTGVMSDIYRYTGISATDLFENQSADFTPLWLSSVAAGDVNNDGWPDVITAGETIGGDRVTDLYFNTNGSFVAANNPFPGMRTVSMDLGDYDDDGDLDLALAGLTTNGSVSAIYCNLGNAPNTKPVAPSALTAVVTNGNEVILTWQPGSDAETPPEGLTYNLYVGDSLVAESIVSPHADIATGKRRMFEAGNAGYSTEVHLRNLPSNQTFEWGVQTIDSAYAGSTFSNGAPFDISITPDYVISDIQIQRLPFSATVTVKNQGADNGRAGKLSVWLNKPETAAIGEIADATQTVGELTAGSTTNLIFESFTLPTTTTTNEFRAFINSDYAEVESYTENNQASTNYVYTVYPSFWFQATALDGSVYLRWKDPQAIGAGSPLALIHYATNSYPVDTNNGIFLYQGTNSYYHHSSLIQNQTYFYTIWITHDGTNWFAPPD
jgi:hypothetical protein